MSENDDFEKMVTELQRKIEREEELTYSKTVIAEYRNPNNFRNMKNPDALGKVKGSCGDTVKITLSVENDIITDACFWTDGCGASIACSNMLTNTIKGKTMEEASAITSTKLIEILGGLPKEHKHCATLAVSTLHNAIEDYHKD
jgi:nitrogen fixation NifU-like protein